MGRAFSAWHSFVSEIMLFIGKPTGRSLMISYYWEVKVRVNKTKQNVASSCPPSQKVRETQRKTQVQAVMAPGCEEKTWTLGAE